jgi:ribonuclease HI
MSLTRTFHLFTDGSCINNGKPNARAGIGIYILEELKDSIDTDTNQKNDDLLKNGQEYALNIISVFKKFDIIDTTATNQRAELSAILSGLYLLTGEIEPNVEIIVKLYTDSSYSINSMTKWYKSWIKNNWKTSKGENVRNKDLLEKIIEFKELLGKNLYIQHVKSHKQQPSLGTIDYFKWYGNDKADKLANYGMRIKLNKN